MTVPFDGRPLHEQADLFRRLVDLGYSDAWSAEADGFDAFTPLALASVWAPELRLGTAIVPAYTRSPACLAQCVAGLAAAAPGRALVGIGASSNVIVERWNGLAFDKPYQRVRDVLRFLRVALTGEKVVEEYESFRIDGFRLGRPPEQPPKLLVAALRSGMLRLAGREADGVIINWLSAGDVAQVVPVVRDAAAGADREVVARLFVCPSEDTETVRERVRPMITAYLNVPVYAAFHEWLGHGDELQPMWDAWRDGDRKAALAAVPDAVVDRLVIHGSVDECRAHIDRFIGNGVTTTSLTILPMAGVDVLQAMDDLAPARV